MQILQRVGVVAIMLLVLAGSEAQAQAPVFRSEAIFPAQNDHTHGSTLVQLPNGDLLAGWFQGSGERQADDVQIMGARKKSGSDVWSAPFLLADVDGFPDINPVLFLDGKDRLWLMWYTVLANQWETSLLKYRISENYADMAGAPEWVWQADLHVKPGGKTEYGIQSDDPFVASVKRQLEGLDPAEVASIDADRFAQWKKETLANAGGQNLIREGRVRRADGTYEERPMGYPYFRRVGWQTRNKPFITSSGRMIVPLYSDGFSFSLMAYTDDSGDTWKFSEPLVGLGNIQPAIAVTGSGDLVAYMRDNGPPPKRLHVSRSTDNGVHWSPVRDTELPNPGSAADIVTLENGHWVLVYNDTERERNSLAVSLSEDEGRTWPWTRHIELDESENPASAHYPAIIQGQDGNLHMTYSYFLPGSNTTPERKTIKYATFNETWIKGE